MFGWKQRMAAGAVGAIVILSAVLLLQSRSSSVGIGLAVLVLGAGAVIGSVIGLFSGR